MLHVAVLTKLNEFEASTPLKQTRFMYLLVLLRIWAPLNKNMSLPFVCTVILSLLSFRCLISLLPSFPDLTFLQVSFN